MTVEFSSLLHNEATPAERAEEKTSGERWINVDVDIIRRSKDPWTCPEHLLNFLAFERSVDIWDPNWSVEKKRRVIAASIQDHRLKGTEEGTRRYIEHAGGELVQVVVPPQAFYAGPSLSKAEWDVWVGKHPKVRITLAQGTIDDLPANEGFFASGSFAGWSYTTVDYGPVLHGRRAFLVQGDEEVPLQLWKVAGTDETVSGLVEEHITVPGIAGDGFFADDGYAGVHYVDALDQDPVTHTIQLDRTYTRPGAELILSVVPVGFEPRDTTYHRESEIWDDDDGVYAGWSYASNHYATPDISASKLADVLYLFDPSVPSPEMIGISFANVSRVGMGHHTARLLVDLKPVDRPGETYAGISFAGEIYALPADPRREEFMLAAIDASQRLTDKIGTGVSFGIYRQRTVQDGIPLDGSYELGGLIKNWI